MFDNLTVFQTASAMAAHAAQSQALISQNVANSDTPGYIGKEMPPFKMLYSQTGSDNSQRATRDNHLNGAVNSVQMSPVDMRGSDNPNKNTISLETEMMKAAEAKSHHDRALAIYKSALDVLHVAVRTR